MTEHPVIVSASEAKAILAGKQTQLRVPAWMEGHTKRKPSRHYDLKPGDLLWVREPFVEFVGWRRGEGKYGIGYGHIGRCTMPPHMLNVERKVFARQPERMARQHSRITLEVTCVQRERLYDISDLDILASGFEAVAKNRSAGFAPVFDPVPSCFAATPIDAFVAFWDQRFGAGAWRRDSTDEFVAITFRDHEANIEAFLKAREHESGELAVVGMALA